jgi:hypothetical protein
VYTKHILYSVYLQMIICLLVGCTDNSRAITGDHSWLVLPSKLEYENRRCWKPLQNSHVIPLSGENERKSIEQLQNNPFIQLSTSQIKAMSLNISNNEHKEIYLVRAIRSNTRCGNINVLELNGDIWVEYDALANKPILIGMSQGMLKLTMAL